MQWSVAQLPIWSGISSALLRQSREPEEEEEENLFIYKKQQRPFVMLREYYRAEDYIDRKSVV